MKSISLGLMGFFLVWLHVSAAHQFSIWGVKPNLLLMGVIIAGLRWMNPWVLMYAAFAGLVEDTYSHSLLGVYGLSFLATVVVAYYAGRSLFEQNILFMMLAVVGITLFEGLLAITLLRMVEGDVPGLKWFFSRTLPVALYHGALTPLFIFSVRKWELLFDRE
ncbi:MAG: rod shape-determining protein MreD [Deltaproteobacteria bacterium]|nr:rod shape-determining protein MreD [Deltaproteobacteria bacterium]